MDKIDNPPIALKSVPIYNFNWETIDWMPTPPGQSQIPVPWIGQGSIASLYSLDVVNDYKKIDGWELVYSTFDPNASGMLVNPYFILYNKYRGVLRIYLYTTTQFVQPSTYLQDGLNIISSGETTMLNFLGNDVVDISTNKNSYSQMQPKPMDGSYPLASNKWYMLQYEIAYDPSIKSKTSNDIMLSWFTNFYGVSDVKLFGQLNGSINGSIGSSQGGNFFSKLGRTGKTAGTVALSALGVDFIDKNTIDAGAGTNKLNLPNNIFKAMSKGVSSALSGAASNLPGSIFNLFSGLLSKSGSAGQSVDLKFNAEIDITGDITNYGSFPSSPTSMYVPGTIIDQSVQGYIPAYTKPLGVFYLNSKPVIQVQNITSVKRTGSPRTGFSFDIVHRKLITEQNNAGKLIINNDLLSYANVSLVDEDVVYIRQGDSGTISSYNGTLETIGKYSEVYSDCTEIIFRGAVSFTPAVRMTLKVSPKNGQPPTYIIHTFLANEEIIQ